MCDKNIECINVDREICDFCEQSTINLLEPKINISLESKNCRTCPHGRINSNTGEVECTYGFGCVND